MKQLSKFEKFQLGDFLNGKALAYLDKKPYYPYVDGAAVRDTPLRIKVDCVIIKDETNYGEGQPEHINAFEKISFKLPGKTENDIDFNYQDLVWPQGIIKASVYGDYRNNLSVECKNMITLDELKKRGDKNAAKASDNRPA